MRDLVDLARKLEDLTRNAGKHAGGVVIAPTAADRLLPAVRRTRRRRRAAQSVTQFDKDDVEAIGLVKFDFLGLRTLTIIDWAVKAINARRAREAGEAPLDIADAAARRHGDLRAASHAATDRGVPVRIARHERAARKLRSPTRFEDIIALAALFRPGPLRLGHGRRLHRPQARPRGSQLPAPAAGADARSRPTASSCTRNR